MKTVSLLQFVLLVSTTMFTDVCLAICGCNGTSHVYVQYKPPVTGWFQLMAGKPCFQRELSREINNRAIQYIICYKRKWTLWENTANTYKRILKFRGNTSKLKVICPQTVCRLSIIKVEEHPILYGKYFPVHDGNILYTEFDTKLLNEFDPQKLNKSDQPYFVNLTMISKTTSITPSPVMIMTDLSTCLRNPDTNSKVNDDAFKRTESVVYVREDGRYNFTQAPDGDFWWITSEDLAFAISNQGAACAYDLSHETEWTVISDNGELDASTMKVNFFKHE